MPPKTVGALCDAKFRQLVTDWGILQWERRDLDSRIAALEAQIHQLQATFRVAGDVPLPGPEATRPKPEPSEV